MAETPPLTLPALLAGRRGDDGDGRRALVTEDDAVTYAQLDDRSRALAARLVAAGVVKGDRVGLLAPNGIAWATTALAVMRVGAVLVPLSTLLRPPELLAQLTTAAVRHLVLQPGFRDRRYLDDLDAAAPGLRAALAEGGRHPSAPALTHLWLLGEVPHRPAAAPDALVRAMEARVSPADDLAILFTSGSRGAPKGTIHTHGGALRATAAGIAARRVGSGERLYIPMPFFWTGGFSGGLFTALVAGATLLTEAEPEPTRTLALLERERATLFRGWPDQAARLAAHPAFADADLSSLGDGSLPAVLPADRRPAPRARPNLFGMTETFGAWCGDRLDVDLPPDKHGSCGRPFAGWEVRIADPDTGEAVPPGHEGEIRLRGPNLLRGICGRSREEVFTVDGFYPTGDLGRQDEDGYVWYSGRLDDMVKVKGATVYPSEVEAALLALDAVRQACVTDVDGEIAALVVTGTGAAPGVAPDTAPGEVVAALRQRLSAFKVPTRWVFTEALTDVPVSGTGKVDKPALQRLLRVSGSDWKALL